jgi:CheY-like chemotaxis protein
MKPIVCLLIDDDSEEAEIFHYALEELNRPVKCVNCKSGKEAIAYLNKHVGDIDYVFLDMNMPRMSGVECLQQLRKLPATNMVPIVLYSSSFIEEQKELLKAMGASAFLNKTGSVFDLQNSLFRLFATEEINKLTVA